MASSPEACEAYLARFPGADEPGGAGGGERALVERIMRAVAQEDG